jgi:hypothetical protein
MSDDETHESPNDPGAKPTVRQLRTGEEFGEELQRPPLLVPTPLPEYLDRHPGQHVRVTWHRYDNDPDAAPWWGNKYIPGLSWHGAVSLDGLWTVTGIRDGQVRVVPELEFHTDRFDGGWWVTAEQCWVHVHVDDPSPRDGLEGPLPSHDSPTHGRSRDPSCPPSRRLRQAFNVDVLLGARAVIMPRLSDRNQIPNWGWRVCSEPYELESILPNLSARSADDLDRPLKGACVRLCREREWFQALAHGAALPLGELNAWTVHQIFIE